MSRVHLRGAVGDRLAPDGLSPRPSVEVHASGATYAEALAALHQEVPEGRLLLTIMRIDPRDPSSPH